MDAPAIYKDSADQLAAARRHYRKNHARSLASTKARKAAARGRNAEHIRALKATTPCADCHQILPPVCMDFDHVRGQKVGDVCHIARTPCSLQRLMDEIAKCEIVCANCHRLRTAARSEGLEPSTSRLTAGRSTN